ncbi:TonB-dependent receptor [Lutibacter sp. TH_r2]|uniref:TonB-dependent receptor n=1 Tax=Lutibacter sp. TH_r2 TaxID=3082083 RepID=UPI002952E443|nr:TonB-dependent receptor [Lutibacter sp. TH_r2]MDV7186647.1 TonB-dependent receptor [Lutibacter sp. TH_r2]
MKKIYKFLTFIIIAASFSMNAQNGRVAGSVIDGEYNEPLAFATIVVKGTTIGTTTDFDGKYTLALQPGTYTLLYSFIGYDTQEITEVVIKENAVNTLDITLNTNTLDTVVITTSVKKNTEAAVLNYQKKSATLLDGLSSQTISKTGASDLASAVKSVPGVSVQGGKYVYVRGLGDRYTKSMLNGVDIPGLDPDRNSIQMDIFPTNILENVIVIKAASAEYPADFTGGLVDIVTKDFPNQFEASLKVGVGYNPDMHFNKNYLSYSGSDTDIFGFDNGLRDRPINRYQPIPGTFENRRTLTTLTSRFGKELAAKKETSGMNYDFGFTLGNQYDVGNDRFGFLTSFSYKNSTEFYENRVDGAYVLNQDKSENEQRPVLTSNGAYGINNIIANGLLGLTYKTDLSKFRVNLLHIQNGESSAGFFNQSISQDGTGGAQEPLVKHALTYTERSVTNILFSGSHQLGESDDAWDFDWKFSPTLSKVHDKDHRITPLQISGEGEYSISPSASTFPIRLWRTLQEESWVGKVDFKKNHEMFNRSAKFKVGGSYVMKFRDFEVDDYTFKITGDDGFIADGNIDNMLADENLWTYQSGEGTHLIFGDQYNPNDSYEGKQNIYSAYVSTEFSLSDKFKSVLGLRSELFQSYYTGQDDDVIYDSTPVLDEYDLFPSANLIYELNDDSKIRASYYRTTARPSFKEASKSQIFDPITGYLFIGNIDLKPTYVNNFDLRYEIFRERGQMVSVSGFYKDFTDPIEKVFFLQAPTQVTVDNLGSAKVYGVELEFRQRLDFISDSFDNFKLSGNVSIMKSELEMQEDEYQSRLNAARDGQTIENTRDLQGQSPYLINAGLDYSNSELGFEAGLFYNVQGETLEVVGTGDVPDVYIKPFHSLNFTLNKTLGEDKKSKIDLKIKNILDQDKESVFQSYKAMDQVYSLRTPGFEFSLGYTYKF